MPDVFEPCGAQILGYSDSAAVGFLVDNAWDSAHEGDASYHLDGAWLVLSCLSASTAEDAVIAVGALEASPDSDSACMPTVLMEIQGELAHGCDPSDRSGGDEGNMEIEITSIAQAWHEGELQPNGLAVYGMGPTTDWSAEVDLTGDTTHAPYVSYSFISCTDRDEDGFCSWDDCDDGNSEVHPSMVEACNGLDDNCDGQIDEGFDLDGDGFVPCEGEDTEPDCDDTDPERNPGQYEECDGIDNDCDGERDEDCTYDGADNDLDGFREIDGDEDDSDAAVFPGAPDVDDESETEDSSSSCTETTVIESRKGLGCHSSGSRPWFPMSLLLFSILGLRQRTARRTAH